MSQNSLVNARAMGDVIALSDGVFQWIVGDIDEVISSMMEVWTPCFADILGFSASWTLKHTSNSLDLIMNAFHFVNAGLDVTVSLLNCKSDHVCTFHMIKSCLCYEIKEFIKTDMLDDRARYDFSKPLTINFEIRPGTANILKNPHEFKALDLQLDDFLDNSHLSDVKIYVEDVKLHAHKIILAAASPVFAGMFRNPNREVQEGVIRIEDMTSDVVLQMLRFIYTGKIELIGSHSVELLAAAEKYELQRLKYEYGKYLCNTIKIENVVEYLRLANLYKIEELKERAIEFVVKNGKEMMLDEPEFNSLATLPADVVTRLIGTLILRVK